MVDLFEMFERDGKNQPNGQRRKGFRGLMDRVMGALDMEGGEDDDNDRHRQTRPNEAAPTEQQRRERKERESFFDD